jgi:hypothetical protein
MLSSSLFLNVAQYLDFRKKQELSESLAQAACALSCFAYSRILATLCSQCFRLSAHQVNPAS